MMVESKDLDLLPLARPADLAEGLIDKFDYRVVSSFGDCRMKFAIPIIEIRKIAGLFALFEAPFDGSEVISSRMNCRICRNRGFQDLPSDRKLGGAYAAGIKPHHLLYVRSNECPFSDISRNLPVALEKIEGLSNDGPRSLV